MPVVGTGLSVLEMRVVGVGVEADASRPVLLLQEAGGDQRVLPLWVGAGEAAVISLEQQNVVSPRPMTHQLIAQVVDAFDRQLDYVCITELRESIFHATLVFDDGMSISARPSDAVALALHLGTPIRAEEQVLDDAAVSNTQISMPGQETEAEAGTEAATEAGASPEEAEREVERFRRFLDSAAPEDFDPN